MSVRYSVSSLVNATFSPSVTSRSLSHYGAGRAEQRCASECGPHWNRVSGVMTTCPRTRTGTGVSNTEALRNRTVWKLSEDTNNNWCVQNERE